MKTLFEQMGGTYTLQGDYNLPNLLPPSTEERPIGVWGQRRLQYIKSHRRILYFNLRLCVATPLRQKMPKGEIPCNPIKKEKGFDEMSNRKRTVDINIRVTDSDKKRIERYAKKCKLSVSEYLRQLANGYTPRELPKARLYDICWQIELLLNDFGKQRDEVFKSYLSRMLNDLRLVCNGYYPLTDTESKSLSVRKRNIATTVEGRDWSVKRIGSVASSAVLF